MYHRSHRRGRAAASILSFAGALMAVAALSPVAGASTPVAKKPVKPATTAITPTTPVTAGSGYLALGDSVVFGYEEPNVVPAPDYPVASSFVGYPEMLGTGLKLKVANASCPGETSSSLVNASAASFGCEQPQPGGTVAYRTAFPLHVKYTGSQLAYAVTYLKSHPGTRLVSLMIGANDLFSCQVTTADGCTSLLEQASLAGTVETNIKKTLTAIRKVYNGQIVFVDYYAAAPAYAASLPTLTAALNGATKPYHVEIANPEPAFVAAAAHSGGSFCTADLLTQLATTPASCGVHPSYAGQALIAQTVLGSIKLG